jgi:hypothetical protein
MFPLLRKEIEKCGRRICMQGEEWMEVGEEFGIPLSGIETLTWAPASDLCQGSSDFNLKKEKSIKWE